MIVISNPIAIANEINLIHSLFEEGLELFHLRKPDYSLEETQNFINRINPDFRSQLVLHNHHQIAEDFGINRIHFSEKTRSSSLVPARFPKPCRYSTSTHSIKDFNTLENHFEYAFLSPVFKSISKENYVSEIDLFEALKSRTNTKTKVIALGGINSENIQKTLENGFDDAALLGAIWSNENPLKQFKLCQQIVRTHLLSQV
ncbi:thiamine-phosphate pyrophosphorylase [Flavobacterium sp. 270]|uniref:thiamine phosphate synthase n=1 Tax=Flavobacterium sp. 270 TaxID=2512114 RepID=UPI00106658AD|nr:thiamine phosphate synthase [Flavobacterium sp. 270]TDW49630.1 thiamine-phosphate pyrophosphorylase [Flavobacterium sp. 270]